VFQGFKSAVVTGTCSRGRPYVPVFLMLQK
jgi:hypothetical protein